MKQRGFSVVELMVTLAIAGIVLTIAVPSFQTTLLNNRILTHSNELVVGLNYTRSEAIKRGSFVSICASSNQTTCTGDNWNAGWIIFVDRGTPGQVDGTDTILRVYTSNSTDVNISLGGATYVRYSGVGFLADAKHLFVPKYAAWINSVVNFLPGQPAYATDLEVVPETDPKPVEQTITPVALNPSQSSFIICDPNHHSTKGRSISISPSGRISSSLATCE